MSVIFVCLLPWHRCSRFPPWAPSLQPEAYFWSPVEKNTTSQNIFPLFHNDCTNDCLFLTLAGCYWDHLQTESSIFLNIKKKGEMSPFYSVTCQWCTYSLVVLYLLACGLLCDCFIGWNLDGIRVCKITVYSQLWKCFNLKNNEHGRTSSLSASSLGQ